jgi:cytoskeletal protein CcmA (bactofilin family)
MRANGTLVFSMGTLEFHSSTAPNAAVRSVDQLTIQHDDPTQPRAVKALYSKHGDVIVNSIYVADTVEAEGGDIDFTFGRAGGKMTAAGNITIHNSADVQSLESGGDLFAEDTVINGKSTAKGNATFSYINAYGDAESGGHLQLDNGTKLVGNTTSEADTILYNHSAIEGNVKVHGRLIVAPENAMEGKEFQSPRLDQTDIIQGKNRIAGTADVAGMAYMGYVDMDGALNVGGDLFVDYESNLNGSITTTGQNVTIQNKSLLKGDSLTAAAEKIVIDDSQVGLSGKPTQITVKLPANADKKDKQQVIIKTGSVVNANITFESGSGTVLVAPGADFKGTITGGTQKPYTPEAEPAKTEAPKPETTPAKEESAGSEPPKS